MATALTLLYLVAFPLTGTALAILSFFASSRPAAGSPAPPEVRARLRILLVHIITLVVFAFLLMALLSGPRAGELPNPVQEAAAMAYGVPALLAGVGFALLYLQAVPAIVERPELFGKVLNFAVLPENAAVFGLIVAFLLTGLPLQEGASSTAVEAARRAAIYISIGGLGAPLAAIAARRGWDFKTPERWFKALVITAAASQPLLIGFLVLAVLSVGQAAIAGG